MTARSFFDTNVLVYTDDAELEFRVAFFHSVRTEHDAQLSPYSGSSQLLNLEELIEQKKRMSRPKDRAAADLLEAVLQYRRQHD